MCLGCHTILCVSLLRVSEADFPPAPFTERHVELLKIFADQAVIALENTRLFEAEQGAHS